MKTGAFTFVLHSYLPYVRRAGRWPHGEEMLHQAVAETYIPLLNALYDLVEEGLEPRLTLGITPILMEQLADADVQAHFEGDVEGRLALLEADRQRYASTRPDLVALTHHYLDWHARILDSFRHRFACDLIGAFRSLLHSGRLDIVTCAATHAYLPLLRRESSMRAQLRVGVESCLQHMGRAPRGIWLPECAYRPGLEEALADLGLGYFFTDTHVVLGAEPSEKAAGDALGLYGSALDRHIQRSPDAQAAVTGRTTMRPYRVRDSDVAVLGRDGQTGRQVWSASGGYPGDPAYREFHRKDEHSGAQYWRVTGPTVELGQKELYDPRVRAATGPGPRRSLCLPRRGRAVRVPHSLPDARNRRLCL